MKNYKKFILLIIGLLICCLLFILTQIYAKYLSSTSGSTTMQIANWNVKVNNQSIKTNTNLQGHIIPVFPGSEHISSNIIAPTAEGYFDLNFDFSQVDVSCSYTIQTSVNSNSSVTDLIATGYSIDDGPTINLEHPNDSISDTILLTNQLRTRKIRVFILWNDDETTQSMINTDDTQATISSTPALLDVNISFTQVIETTP